MNKVSLSFVSYFFYCGFIFAQSHPAPRTYVAYRAVDPVIVDGKAGEKSWKEVPFSEDFIDIEGVKKPKFQTNFKMVWDETYLYFYAKMEEPHIWATLKQRDTVIFYNNDFEIFIDPDGDTHNYLEFEMNALNTVWDLLLVKPYRERAPVVDNLEIKGLKSAVYIEGTLNNPKDEDQFWSVEVAMPWEVLNETNFRRKTPENSFWRINFSRVNWDYQLENGTYSRKKDEKGKFLPEYNWVWSPQWVVNMHEPEKWGYVYFSSKKAGEHEEFSIPEDERIKWILYDLYRAQKEYFRRNGDWAKTSKELLEKPFLINQEEIHPQIEPHASGWNIFLSSPFSGKRYLIKEDGEFIEIKN